MLEQQIIFYAWGNADALQLNDSEFLTQILFWCIGFLTLFTVNLSELAKKWDADEKSPSMILFMDGNPLTRIYEETFYLDIVAKVGKYCRPAGEEHKELK